MEELQSDGQLQELRHTTKREISPSIKFIELVLLT
jgi:hypothetical protein